MTTDVMQTMTDVRVDMKRLHGEIHGMQGMRPMQDRMDRMMTRMAQMERHRQQMMKRCPALEPPASLARRLPGAGRPVPARRRTCRSRAAVVSGPASRASAVVNRVG